MLDTWVIPLTTEVIRRVSHEFTGVKVTPNGGLVRENPPKNALDSG